MKWLKWHHKFSSGRGAWEWYPVGDDVDDDEAHSIVAEFADEYSHSDKYSGIDYEIVDKAPRWVVEKKAREAGERRRAADDEFRLYTNLLDGGEYLACRQCDTATAATHEHYREYGTGTEIKPCPTCGREILSSTMAFWLMPDDKDAVKLLGSLVEQGPRSIKSKKHRWPVESEEEEQAYHRLSKLGLAGGSAYQNIYEIHATSRGEAEWLKHKEQHK